MKDLLTWTLETIRGDDTMMSWLEERRYDWAPIVGSAITKILEGQSVIILTDEQNRWFEEYIVRRINRPGMSRPLLPFFSFEAVYPYVDTIKSDQDIDLLFDMLSISYEDRFFVWYIGRSTSSYVRIAKRRDDSFLWIMDEDMQNNFTLQSFDDLLDIKLLQLFRLFEKSLEAAIFGEVEFG